MQQCVGLFLFAPPLFILYYFTMARPTDFTPELGDRLIKIISEEGGFLWYYKSAIMDKSLPQPRTIYDWIHPATEETAPFVRKLYQACSDYALKAMNENQAPIENIMLWAMRTMGTHHIDCYLPEENKVS